MHTLLGIMLFPFQIFFYFCTFHQVFSYSYYVPFCYCQCVDTLGVAEHMYQLGYIFM